MKKQAKDLRRKTLDSRHSMWFKWPMLAVMFAMSALSSCEKVIDVDLNDSDPKLVVEGLIMEDSICSVRLTMTSNYFDSSEEPTVENAVVTLIPSTGPAETLTHIGAGVYQSTTIGEAGRSYTLAIVHNGEVYEATSTLFPAPEIDSLVLQQNTFGSFMDYWVSANWTDNPATDDYYRMYYIKYGERQNDPIDITVVNDDFVFENGQMEVFNGFIRYETGDTAIIELSQIDRGVYNYFYTLADVMNNGGFGGSTPYNPTSNVSNGALGYFGAWALSRDTIVVP